MRIPLLTELSVKEKVVFMRVDFNVPLDRSDPDQAQVRDDFRIQKALPSIRWVMDQGGSLFLASHLGRPKSKADRQYTLEPVARHLAALLDRDILFSDDCIGDGVKKLSGDLRKHPGIVVLENLRFYPEEQKNDERFAKKLAEHADCYVNEAFAVSHRADASVAAIVDHFKDRAFGLLLECEYRVLSELLAGQLERPFAVILGGAKVSDKIGVIKTLTERADALFVAGGMANTFLKAKGLAMGSSLVESDKVGLASRILDDMTAKRIAVHLPIDGVVSRSIEDATGARTVVLGGQRGGERLQEADRVVDIGPATLAEWTAALSRFKTILWNGPCGVFETPEFSKGTRGLCDALARLKELGTRVIAGGGETVSAIREANVEQEFYHVSTGGGAMLEFLEGKALPGIEALKEYTRRSL